MVTIIIMTWATACKLARLAVEKCFLRLHKVRLSLWLNRCKVAGKRVRPCSGKNRWKVQIADFADAYLFFRRLAATVNSWVEVHNSREHVFYLCRLPHTSAILVLQNSTAGKQTLATIKIQADTPDKQWLKISFIRRQHTSY